SGPPDDLECPRQPPPSGTNVIRPNHPPLRNEITPRRIASAPGRSLPLPPSTEPCSGWKLRRNGTTASSTAATARHGSESSKPPVSPNASTSGVVTVGPSA